MFYWFTLAQRQISFFVFSQLSCSSMVHSNSIPGINEKPKVKVQQQERKNNGMCSVCQICYARKVAQQQMMMNQGGTRTNTFSLNSFDSELSKVSAPLHLGICWPGFSQISLLPSSSQKTAALPRRLRPAQPKAFLSQKQRTKKQPQFLLRVVITHGRTVANTLQIKELQKQFEKHSPNIAMPQTHRQLGRAANFSTFNSLQRSSPRNRR